MIRKVLEFRSLFTIIALFAFLYTPDSATAQYRRVSVAFYNVENLFDTVPSPFHDDREFTPSGRNKWDTGRYRTKIGNIARVIGDGGFDVFAMAEVENETVLRDLVTALSDDYNFIHRSTSDSRGIDLALLYKGDKFFPEQTRQINSLTTREFLYVRGNLAGTPTGILVCHMPSKFNSRAYRDRAAARLAAVADSIVSAEGCERLIVMGDFNGEMHEAGLRKAFGELADGYHSGGRFYNALYEYYSRGYGSYCWDGRWMLYDNILVSEALMSGEGMRLAESGIFVRPYLLDGEEYPAAAFMKRRGYPLRTFSGARYLGGYSDHLPVFAVFGL